MSGSDAISPTAHYTGQVWVRAGLSDPALATPEGRLLYESLRGANWMSGALGGPTLEGYLLARHRALDALLTHAIERDGVRQVLEVACGLSPRGWRFAQRFGERITYVEADLPAMAARKRRALAPLNTLGEHHRVVELDALRPSGPGSLAAVAGELEPAGGLVVITEGLLGYLAGEQVRELWQRLAAVLDGFRAGRYLSDVQLGGLQTPVVRGFRVLLSAFVRGRVHLHFAGPAQARAALRAAGFATARVRRATSVAPGEGPGSDLAHIIEASTNPTPTRTRPEP